MGSDRASELVSYTALCTHTTSEFLGGPDSRRGINCRGREGGRGRTHIWKVAQPTDATTVAGEAGRPARCLSAPRPPREMVYGVYMGRRRARACGNATERKSTVELARPPLSRPIGHHRNLIRCRKSIPKKEKYLARVGLKQAPASRATDKRVSCPLAPHRVASRRIVRLI